MIKFGVKEDRITSLSGGNQQKVLIGRGFAMRPDVIVLNDPARGIDVGAKAELYKHLRTFAEEGRAVVYMSSEIEEFLGFATRVIVFRDGAPFDAFDGRGLEPKRVLEAMFGQTDGAGLARGLWSAPEPGGTGGKPGRAAAATACACVSRCPTRSRRAMQRPADACRAQVRRASERLVSWPEPTMPPGTQADPHRRIRCDGGARTGVQP